MKYGSYFGHADFCTRKILNFLPCSLLLSPLWEAWPPLEGPGVPAEWVEVASSWSRQDEGFWCQDAKEFSHSYHLSHKWGTMKTDRHRGRKKSVYILVFSEITQTCYSTPSFFAASVDTFVKTDISLLSVYILLYPNLHESKVNFWSKGKLP